MIIKRLSSFLLFVLVSFFSNGQKFHDEIRFLEHLEGLGAYNEALYYLDNLDRSRYNEQQVDSLFFIKGRYYYELKEVEKSISAFAQVGPSIKSLNEVSRIYVGFQLSYARRFTEARMQFHDFGTSDSLRASLVNFELAAISLLERDLDGYSYYATRYKDEFYVLSDYQKDMDGIYSELLDRNRKSPVVAGVLSAIVPGSGKLYNGQIGPGIMGLVSTGIFGLQAYEGYRKDGLKSARFIIFGSLFSTFYIANIWGSAVSVRVAEQRYNHTVDEAIFINMHLPIRLLYR